MYIHISKNIISRNVAQTWSVYLSSIGSSLSYIEEPIYVLEMCTLT